MRATQRLLIALALMMGVNATRVFAQRLDGSDRLLLYYYSFQKNRTDAQTLQLQQKRIATDLYQFRASQLASQDQARRAGEPLERALRGNGRSRVQRRTPPPIYSGFGGSQQYFGRSSQFNPPNTTVIRR